MSESYETSNPVVLHSVTTSANDFYVHEPATSSARCIENQSDGPATCGAFERAPYFAVKSTVDRIVTAMLMIVALPLMLLVGLAILILDGRPVFYRQTRVGKHGREYRMWKFRTMCRDAESATGAVWSSPSDPRITPLGRWLRCSHLDELPQFINVLVGDMNLIGPRPERPRFVRDLTHQLPSYRDRLSARPGITGLAQLRLGYDQSIEDVQRKLLLDLQYIRTASLLQDARIVLGTFPYIAGNLLHKWKTDPTARLDVKNTCQIDSCKNDGTTSVHRPDPASSGESGPHTVPTTSSDASTHSSDVQPNPLLFTMDGVLPTTEHCP